MQYESLVPIANILILCAKIATHVGDVESYYTIYLAMEFVPFVIN